MSTESEIEPVQPNVPASTAEVVAAALANASDVLFHEGRSPYAFNGAPVRLDLPESTREDIENFIRATAPADKVAQLEIIAAKTREDYQTSYSWDTIQYSLNSGEYFYRCHYSTSMGGSTLTIRRIPTPSGTAASSANVVLVELPHQ